MSVKVPIRAASRLSGVSVDCIRAWERRYRALNPERAKGGRLFSESDIYRLKLLKRAVGMGHSIGQIANLNTDDLENLPFNAPNRKPRPRDERNHDFSDAVAELAEKFITYDQEAADELIGKVISLVTPREFVYSFVIPFLQHVDEAWKDEEFRDAQRHMISASMRNAMLLLGGQIHRPNTAATVLFTTLPGEEHQHGIMIASMLATAGSLRPVYLGTNLPVDEIIQAADTTHPAAVVIGVKPGLTKLHDRANYLRQLRKGLSLKTDIVLEGLYHNESLYGALRKIGINPVKDFEEYEDLLQKYHHIIS